MSTYKLQDSFISANVNSSPLLHRILCSDSLDHDCLWNNATVKKDRNQSIVARTEHARWDFYFSAEHIAELITYQNGNLPAKLVLSEAKPARLKNWSMLMLSRKFYRPYMSAGPHYKVQLTYAMPVLCTTAFTESYSSVLSENQLLCQ